MAAFPDIKIDWKDLGEAPESIIERTDMERGIPKQHRIASDARVEIPITAIFDTKAEAADFEEWFYVDNNAGANWFDFTLPRTGAVVQARVVNGDIGTLKFDQPTLEASNRQFKLEYWRSTW